MKLLGAAYLIYLGARMFMSAKSVELTMPQVQRASVLYARSAMASLRTCSTPRSHCFFLH